LKVLAEITAREIASPSARNDELVLPPIKSALIEFVDIAGLVKGASEGAGLGNKFLSHIREVSVIAHVVRAFEDENIIKEGAVDPLSDYVTINTELMLADMQTVQKVLENRKIEAVRRSGAEKLLAGLNAGTPAREIVLTDEEREATNDLFLLSNKKEIIVLNVSEEQYNPEGIKKVTEEYKSLLSSVIPTEVEGSNSREKDSSTTLGMTKGWKDDNIVVICAKIESDLAGLPDIEQQEYLSSLGLSASGLERLIQKAYARLGLISFLTCGEKEVRAWTITKGMDAPHAAGEIHTDFIKHFIKAEVVSYADFVALKGWKGAREAGKARQEGKEYIMQDGDVVEFKIGK
jgi:ribosome-binding ATPase YchF (GTP1/OBG family)